MSGEIKRPDVPIYTATATIKFQSGYICCQYCPVLNTYSRNHCNLTGEIITDPKMIGYECPLDFRYPEDEYEPI